MAKSNDQRKSSATFGVEYPTSQEALTELISDKPDKTFKNKDLTFKKNWGHFENVTFEACRVKYDSNIYKEKAVVRNVVFKTCTFYKSFLGSTLYENITFTNCDFSQCDFYFSTFKNCNFTGCKFNLCTAWLINFENTVISAIDFMKGIYFPENYAKTDKDLNRYKNRHFKTCLDIACNLIKTASETYDSHNTNLAIYAHKLELVKYYKFKMFYLITKKPTTLANLKKSLEDIPSLFELYVINIISNGGTSLRIIFCATLALVLGIGPLLLNYSKLQLSVNGSKIFLSDQSYWFQVFSGIEAFMGFGYGNFFQTQNSDKYFLIALPIFGFFLLALFLHAFIKKVFR